MPPRFKSKHVPRRRGDDVALTPGRTITQTVKRDGKRVTIKQKMLSDGSVKTTVDEAHTLEADLQASQVDRLKARGDYELDFTFAGDQNAARRGPVAAAEAKRTGMMAGDPDLRLSIAGGVTAYIENKNGGGYLSKEQKDRHELLERLGFQVWIIKTDDKRRAADAAERILDAYLSGNQNFVMDDFPEISRFVKKTY